MKTEIKQKKLKVFEAFAGIGAQASALKRLNIEYEIVGISEWFIEAILCYDQIQNDGLPEIELPTKEKQIEYLNWFIKWREYRNLMSINDNWKSSDFYFDLDAYFRNIFHECFGSFLKVRSFSF